MESISPGLQDPPNCSSFSEIVSENVIDPYSGREQTKAKHYILMSYLQALAFKVLTFQDITYVDGFSGPWETKTDDFSDSSFMIAISVLLDAQKQYLDRSGIRRKVRCFFSEKDPDRFQDLEKVVKPLHRPAEEFEIKTYFGSSKMLSMKFRRLSVVHFR